MTQQEFVLIGCGCTITVDEVAVNYTQMHDNVAYVLCGVSGREPEVIQQNIRLHHMLHTGLIRENRRPRQLMVEVLERQPIVVQAWQNLSQLAAKTLGFSEAHFETWKEMLFLDQLEQPELAR